MDDAWVLNANEKVVQAVRKRLEVTGGHCPCVPSTEWNDDTLCECLTFRSGKGCHCKLYIPAQEA